ncbi:uncharacterized protein TNCV_916731 [Trichonephila clavipes]|nr:uncharacterized protein TNCV_916731 [Trichonephila clavipes]
MSGNTCLSKGYPQSELSRRRSCYASYTKKWLPPRVGIIANQECILKFHDITIRIDRNPPTLCEYGIDGNRKVALNVIQNLNGLFSTNTPKNRLCARSTLSNGGRGSLGVKVTDSWSACPEFDPSIAEDQPCKGAMYVKSVEAQTSSRWCGVKIRRGKYQLRYRPRHLTMDQNYEIRRQKPRLGQRKGKKADLIKLAIELGECKSNEEELKIIELRTNILTNDAYKEDPEFVKCIFEGIVSNRIDVENKQKEQTLREFELQKIRLQNETQRVVGPQTLPQTKIEFKKLLPTFNPEVDNMDLFLTLFKRQMKLLDLGEDLWVPYLIGALPSDVTSLITQMLADKLEAFDNIRRFLPSGPRRHVKASEIVKDGRQVSFRKPERPPKREYSHQVPNERSPLRCYGCGKQGVIKSRCPTCNLNVSQKTDVATKHINAYTAQTRSHRFTLINITFCGIKGRVCADTGSSHSIAGERMFQIFKDKGLLFQETTLAMSLADG